MDCTFIPHQPPKNLTFDEKKTWYSKKHQSYGIKYLAIINNFGQLIYISKSYPGGVSDISMATDADIITFLNDFLGNSFSVMGDKGFQGLQNFFKTILPKKRSKNISLSLEEKEMNLKISKKKNFN